MLVNEEQAAEMLGMSVQDVERLLADGVLLGRRTEEGWRISKKSIDDYQHQLLAPPGKAAAPAGLVTKPTADRLPFSRTVVNFIGAVAWLGLVLGFALIGVAVVRQTQIVAVFGGAVAFVSIAYIFIHDLMRAVLALYEGLQRPAPASAEPGAAGRRSPYRPSNQGR
ncbi:MAG: hypothetical protein BAA04_04945 [Firmicutes bacterium ZCTH02-B6]|nr:MAG: hypothetical protein BAA04_04945 [Firmicutes bacterium ZCTH02-B6]